MAIAHLVVLGLDNREDAADASRDDKGKVRIQPSINLTAAGAASGAL